MNSNKQTKSINTTTTNLIGNEQYRYFINLQAAYGIAQRGGVKHPLLNKAHQKRLVSDVNILSSLENRQLIFSEIIFSN